VRAIGGDQLDAQGLQLREADLLDHYVAPVIWVTDAIPFVSYLTGGQWVRTDGRSVQPTFRRARALK
jgi:hypothetical protein